MDALLVAKYHLLHAALGLLAPEFDGQITAPAISISRDQIREAAKVLFDSPVLTGAASMLAEYAMSDGRRS